MLAEVVTPEDLEHALASGVFAEGHRLEVKRSSAGPAATTHTPM